MDSTKRGPGVPLDSDTNFHPFPILIMNSVQKSNLDADLYTAQSIYKGPSLNLKCHIPNTEWDPKRSISDVRKYPRLICSIQVAYLRVTR